MPRAPGPLGPSLLCPVQKRPSLTLQIEASQGSGVPCLAPPTPLEVSAPAPLPSTALAPQPPGQASCLPLSPLNTRPWRLRDVCRANTAQWYAVGLPNTKGKTKGRRSELPVSPGAPPFNRTLWRPTWPGAPADADGNWTSRLLRPHSPRPQPRP